MDYNKIFQSKWFKAAVFGVAALIIILLVFKAGTLVGFRKAGFSYKWGENYHQNFAGPRGGFFRGFSGRDFIASHGVFGQIIKIDGSTLIIKGQENVEKIVIVKEDTAIRRLGETVKLSDLKVNDYIVVIGSPNDAGQIEAKFIRIMPPPPQAAGTFSPPFPPSLD